MFAELKSHLEGKRVLIIGVGNRLRGDDAVGSLLVDSLYEKLSVPLIDAGDVPENYIGPIEDSDAEVILVIDAVHLKANAGDSAILDLENLGNVTLSTHSANLGLLFRVFPPERRSKVIILGIQPQTIEFGSDLSEPVQKTMEDIRAMLIELFTR